MGEAFLYSRKELGVINGYPLTASPYIAVILDNYVVPHIPSIADAFILKHDKVISHKANVSSNI